MPDRAFYWLDQAYAQHDPHFAYLRLDPLYDNLREHSRYRELVRKLDSTEPMESKLFP
jgi:hypothetical protein